MTERDLINRISSQFKNAPASILKGIGDDCAVIAESEHRCSLISTDVLVEDVHYFTKWNEAYTLGRKSIAVNLSDVAAMGGIPQFVLISLVLPSHLSEDWLQQWHDGVKSILDEFSCYLIGGDVSKGEQVVINITVLGTSKPEHVLYRSGASAEQDIYVTGELGSSAAGLELLKSGYKRNGEFEPLIKAHLDPHPQIKIGTIIAENRLASSMQDISDGIATDLSHICKASNISAVIFADKIPVDSLLSKAAKELDMSFLDLALFGGEDYQLVFTSNKENALKLQKTAEESGISITKIGETYPGPARVSLRKNGDTSDISFKGFEHV